jgi:hypothetical protein
MRNKLFDNVCLLIYASTVLLLLLSCAKPPNARMSRDFKERRASFSTILLEKPEVEILLGTPPKLTRQTEEEADVSRMLMALTTKELQQRNIQIVETREQAQEKQIDGRMTIRLRIFTKSGVDNTTEFASKLTIALLTAGMVTPYKDVSGSMTLTAILYDPQNNSDLWSNKITDQSFCLVGEANFNIEKRINELFKSFD